MDAGGDGWDKFYRKVIEETQLGVEELLDRFRVAQQRPCTNACSAVDRGASPPGCNRRPIASAWASHCAAQDDHGRPPGDRRILPSHRLAGNCPFLLSRAVQMARRGQPR
jgi:hypothetical protein